MCGRFVRARSAADYARIFGARRCADLPPSWNVAPGQAVLAVRAGRDGTRELVALRWGFVPAWARDPSEGPRPINARAETAARSRLFRDALRRRRCLIPADAFYEWAGQAHGRRQPWAVRRRDGAVMAFAGMWACWIGPDGEVLESCAILTTEANTLLRPIHERMPVILPPEAWGRWLDPALEVPGDVVPLLRPCPTEELEAWPVGRAVNSVVRDGPELLRPAGGEA